MANTNRSVPGRRCARAPVPGVSWYGVCASLIDICSQFTDNHLATAQIEVGPASLLGCRPAGGDHKAITRAWEEVCSESVVVHRRV